MSDLVEMLFLSGSFLGTSTIVAVSAKVYLDMKIAEIRSAKTPYIDQSKSSFTDKFNTSVDSVKKSIDLHYSLGLKNTGSKMKLILSNVDELFNRINIKGTSDLMNTTSVRYSYLFDKIVYAMDENHYVDIAKNPHLWDHPEEKMRKSEEALDAVNNQIINNIKQVNSKQDIDFKIVLDTLLESDSNEASEIDNIFENKTRKISQ